MHPLHLCLHPFLRSWISFSIITLNSFSSRLSISTSLSCSSWVDPSSGTYSSAVSFCLPYCDCGFCSIGCRIVVLLPSAVCPLVDEAVYVACAGFLVGGFLPTGGWSCILPLWWAGRCSERVLVPCLLMGGAVFPPCWLFSLRHPSAGTYRLLGAARSWEVNGGPLEGSHQRVHCRTATANVFVPAVTHSGWTHSPPLQVTLQY